MDGADDPVLIEVDSSAATRAYRAFETWAGSDGIKVFFEPDTMMAIDRPGRRGFLYDEVYFITLWASAGGRALVDLLRADSDGSDRPFFEIKPVTEEPNPERLLALVLEHGVPIEQVRDLI